MKTEMRTGIQSKDYDVLHLEIGLVVPGPRHARDEGHANKEILEGGKASFLPQNLRSVGPGWCHRAHRYYN